MPSKQVAKTLVTILDDPRMKQIQDLSTPVDDLAKKIVSAWSMDLYTRKPGPAYDEDGSFVGTDLDLACFIGIERGNCFRNRAGGWFQHHHVAGYNYTIYISC